MQQELSPALQQKKIAIVSKYGDRVSFLNEFSPDKQIGKCADERVAMLAETPTLTDLNISYGRNTAVMFLIPQLFDISEFCGAKDKFTSRQIEQTAQLIASNYPWLKVLEIMTFCKQFKLGQYGHFYGTIDPMVITCALKDFLLYRREVYADYEDYLTKLRIEAEKKKPHMTFDEWKAQKEAKGEKVNIRFAKIDDNGKEVPTLSPIESLVESAKNLVTNKYGLSMKSLLEMRKAFREQNGMTLEEVIEKYNNNEL